MKRYDAVCGILFVVVAGVILLDARRLEILPIGSGTLPVIIAVVLMLAGLRLVAGLFRSRSEDEKGPAWPLKAGLFNLVYVAGITILYVFTMGWIGFLVATFLFVTTMILRLSRWKWYGAVGFGIGVSVASFWFFEKLGMSLPLWFFERYLM
jgi:hypothetical protein